MLATVGAAARDTVRGSVTGSGQPLGGVAVTDGYRVVWTNSDGQFSLEPDVRSRFIYISIPAGYRPPVEDGLAKFYIPLIEGRFDFVLERKAADDTRHGFIAIADPQVTKEREIEMMAPAVADITATVREHADRDFHGIGCGDIVGDRPDFYGPLNASLAATGIPFYHSVGNHDMKYTDRSFESSLTAYEEVYGPPWYSYNTGEIHYVVLNDSFYIGREYFYIGYLDEAQLHWLEQDLSRVPAGSTVVVTLHIPTTLSERDRQGFQYATISKVLANQKALYSILEGYNTHILSGHIHTTTNCAVNDHLYEHNLAALSGAWWQGTLCTDGTPAGYGVFLCDGGQVEWYYKSVGYPRDHQMRVSIRTDGEGRPVVLANVWNTDPAWTVELYQDGKYSGHMSRTEAVDPLAQELYSDKSKLEYGWIGPTASDHFYTAPLGQGTTTVEVVATDRFGNRYTSSVPVHTADAGQWDFYPADSPDIRFTGRTQTGTDGVSFDWTGVYFCFSTDAGVFELHASDTGKNYYNLFVDGELREVIAVGGDRELIPVTVGLPGTRKEVRLQKRTEGEQGRTTIHGISVPPGYTVAAAAARPGRHIEFIGDSLTCGFGTEGTSPQEPFLPETENCDLGFACITARYFEADHTLIAHSGQGAVRNWDDSVSVSSVAMRHRYLRTYDMTPEPAWDFPANAHKPDVVVINLGSNDYSTSPVPDYGEFAAGYNEIISAVKTAYGPDVPVVCMTPRNDSPAFDHIRRICMDTQYSNILFAPVLPGICRADTDLGSVWHPNHSGHRKMAMTLIPYVASATGWDMPGRPVL